MELLSQRHSLSQPILKSASDSYLLYNQKRLEEELIKTFHKKKIKIYLKRIYVTKKERDE